MKFTLQNIWNDAKLYLVKLVALFNVIIVYNF